MRVKDVFVTCDWRCKSCRQSGQARVWVPNGANATLTVGEHARRTRGMCVTGCLYEAVESATSSDARPTDLEQGKADGSATDPSSSSSTVRP